MFERIKLSFFIALLFGALGVLYIIWWVGQLFARMSGGEEAAERWREQFSMD